MSEPEGEGGMGRRAGPRRRAGPALSEPEGRGGAWTEERGTSDEGRRRLQAPRRRAGTALSSLEGDLATTVGAEHVLTDPDLLDGYLWDWTRRYTGAARCVARPGSAQEVAGVLRCCADRGVPVVTQGGNTGLVGGSVPGAGGQPPAVVLSTRRLRTLDPVDTLAAQVTAGAGVTLAELRAHAAAAGLEYGVDLAARDSATVGGTIATNAGGINTIRYGPTRAQLLGVEAVLTDGSVLSRMAGLAADNTGYDLAQLLAGSEGTLAVITAARLRLWPAEPVAAAVLAGVSGVAAAADLYAEIRAHLPGLRAAEYLEAAGLDLVREAAGLPLPLGLAVPRLPARRDRRAPGAGRTARGGRAAGRYGGRAGSQRPRRLVGLPGTAHGSDQQGGGPAQDGRGDPAGEDR